MSELEFEVFYSGSPVNLNGLDKSKVHHAPFFPMDQVLKVTSLAISNGGIATSYQFLSEAMPFYSLPNNLDQYLNVNVLKKLDLSDYQHISNFSKDRFKDQIQSLMGSENLNQKL